MHLCYAKLNRFYLYMFAYLFTAQIYLYIFICVCLVNWFICLLILFGPGCIDLYINISDNNITFIY